MYEIKGKESDKVYFEGKNKAECLRHLHKKYDGRYTDGRNRSRAKGRIYKEALIIKKRSTSNE